MDQSANGTHERFDKINAALAVVVGFISFIVFRLTVAQTLSYWDCGEFIACSHILGNPHPPGSPLFILIGRLFDILALVKDVAFRINLLSVISSSVTTVFAYLVIVRLVTSWYHDKPYRKLGRKISYAAGFIGALFMAFGQTNWNNAVEAEVYGLSMMVMLAILWLGLKWFDHRYNMTGQRIVLLVAFLAMASVGIHLTVYLIVPIVAIFFGLKKEATKSDWAIVAGYFVFELLLIIVLSGRYENYNVFMGISAIVFAVMAFYLRSKINWPILLSFAALSGIMVSFYPFMIGMISWFIISAVIYFITRNRLWRLAMLIMVVGAIGYSVHIYIPIRSTQHPIIDENTPSRNFSTFVGFLDRAQYGSMSMTKRMFVRRGDWANQFGDHARMGFLRFFKEQYSNERVFPLFLLIGILGMVVMAARNPSWGYILIALVLAASVGLVLYMNFADGANYNQATGDAYQEVRDRDYFFTPAFVLFGMTIGLGMGAIMEMIRKGTEKMGQSMNRTAVWVSMILVLTPIIPVQANYFTNDRSKNRMAYDYAYNILVSCGKNAILFTSGDNDTFPIWCVQEIYNMRQDVRLVNFSLLNTDWYTWQLKNLDLLSAINAGYDLDSLARVAQEKVVLDTTARLAGASEIFPDHRADYTRAYLDSLARYDQLPPGIRLRVPISLEDEQILWVDTVMQGQNVARPASAYYDQVRKRPTYLFPTYYEGQALRVATLMLENIILANKWQYPIYFTSVSGNVRESPLNLTERLLREGIIYKLTPEKSNLAYNEETTEELFFDKYHYDNLSDTMVAQDENASGIALTYPEKMLDYHMYISRRGDTARADSLLDLICADIPSYWRSRLAQRDMYFDRGDTTGADEIKQEMLAYLQGFLDQNPGNIFFYQYMGMTYLAMGENSVAEKYLDQAWEMNIDKEHTFRSLLTLYYEERRSGDMLRVAQQYARYHPDDPMANEILKNFNRMQPTPATPPPPPVQVVPQTPPPQGGDGE